MGCGLSGMMYKLFTKVPLIIVGGIFFVAGVSKALADDGTEVVLRLSHLPTWLIPAIVHMLPGWEIALGLAMLVGWRSQLLMLAGGVTLLLLTAFLIHVASIDLSTRCSCFGPVVDAWIGGGALPALGRNLTLIGLLGISWWTFAREMRGKPTCVHGVAVN
jgi:hypothetical protein